MDDDIDEYDQRQRDLDTRAMTHTPWWVYPVIFVLTAAPIAAGDVAGLGLNDGERFALLGLVAFVVIVALGYTSNGPAPVRRMREGLQPTRQMYVPWVLAVTVAIWAVGLWWFIPNYGADLTHHAAAATHLSGYPNTVAGLLCGAASTALIALSRLLNATVTTRRSTH